ncbi:hypothetical protein GCM10022403_061860 [Streptomyces coacervatus]|uniref:Uncharacterized protein n=1 Tax=Streptomyces coacervatus TaxID=647381 RepID=A0ABP7IJQ4_9ACTN|nr:hypothetical protein [Streptomyces coacervatus]MDF2269984.1 hypothetical protein [Streptomyces coacervatus]
MTSAPQTSPVGRTDDELARSDIPAMLRYGLSFTGPHRTALYGDGAVGAAVLLDRLGIQPRAVAFLAKVVRSGGVRYAAELREPVPGDEAASTVRAWLESAATAADGVDGDEETARWLEAVAELLGLRRVYRSRVAGGRGVSGGPPDHGSIWASSSNGVATRCACAGLLRAEARALPIRRRAPRPAGLPPFCP